MTAAPKLLAGLMPVPVMGMVAKCTMNTANPMGSGASTYENHSTSSEQPDSRVVIYLVKKATKIQNTHRDMGITGTTLGISGREDGVDEDESADDFRTKCTAGVVTMRDDVHPTSKAVVRVLHEGLDKPHATYGAEALGHHVPQRPQQRHLPFMYEGYFCNLQN